jgi:hypothetical protein
MDKRTIRNTSDSCQRVHGLLCIVVEMEKCFRIVLSFQLRAETDLRQDEKN